MKNDLFKGVLKTFIDSAPVIYYIEKHPDFYPILAPIFEQIEMGRLIAVTSPITLAECLVLPIKQKKLEIVEAFMDIIGGGHFSTFVPFQKEIARRAAEIRAKYNLSLVDAFQIAAAIESDCDAFLTNDKELEKIMEIKIIIVGDLER